MKIIVNADDFGKTAEVNAAIEESFRRGYITQTTLMVNMPYADAAVTWAKANGYADKVGLHLNLDEGRPLTDDIKKCRFFCNENGDFVKNVLHQKLFWNGLSTNERDALEKEIRAQVGKYVSYGLPLMHCDGHHHIHRAWWLLPLLLPILRQNGFKSIRRPNNIETRRFNFRHPAIRYRFYAALTERRMRRAEYVLLEAFGGFRDYDRMKSFDWFESGEIMVHPNKVDNGVVYDAEGFDLSEVQRMLKR